MMRYLPICLLLIPLVSTSSFAVKALRLDYSQAMDTVSVKDGVMSMTGDLTFFYTPRMMMMYMKNQKFGKMPGDAKMSDKDREQTKQLMNRPRSMRTVINLDSPEDFTVTTISMDPKKPDVTKTMCSVVKVNSKLEEKARENMSGWTYEVKETGTKKEIAKLASEEFIVSVSDNSKGTKIDATDFFHFSSIGKVLLDFHENSEKSRPSQYGATHMPKVPDALMKRAKDGVIFTSMDTLVQDPKKPENKSKIKMVLTHWAWQEMDARYFQKPKCDFTFSSDTLDSLGLSKPKFDLGETLKKSMPSSDDVLKKAMPKPKLPGVLKGIF